MSFAEALTDPILTVVAFILIALWAGVSARSNPGLPKGGSASVATLLRIACGLLFVAASMDKVGDPATFLKVIKECYDILPAPLDPLAAVVIPWLEFFAGLCLVLGFRWRAAALLFCSLMVVYLLTIGWDLSRGVDCNCGCFKMDSNEKMSFWTLLRDLGFFGMGFIVLVSPRTLLALDRSTD
jgi:uncharacterized membrane protein YphA (DoxX/SURF4 family)